MTLFVILNRALGSNCLMDKESNLSRRTIIGQPLASLLTLNTSYPPTYMGTIKSSNISM